MKLLDAYIYIYINSFFEENVFRRALESID